VARGRRRITGREEERKKREKERKREIRARGDERSGFPRERTRGRRGPGVARQGLGQAVLDSAQLPRDRSVTSFCITRLIASLLPLGAAPTRSSLSRRRSSPQLLAAPFPYLEMPLGPPPVPLTLASRGAKLAIALTGAHERKNLERERGRIHRGRALRFLDA